MADLIDRITNEVWSEVADSRDSKWTLRREHIENAVKKALATLEPASGGVEAPAEDAAAKGETAGQMLDRLGMDGAKWAAEFRTTALRFGYSDMDEGWLIGWFCNAIMAGYDRAPTPAPVATDRVDALVKAAAKDAREVFEDYGSKAREAIDYMEQVALAAAIREGRNG